MQTYFECIPCFIRQAIDVARFVSDDRVVHEHILRTVLGRVATMEFADSPPAMAQYIHRIIREATGNADPYRSLKDQSNTLALSLYEELKGRIAASCAPLQTAVRLAIAGNIIDFAVHRHMDKPTLYASILRALSLPLLDSSVEDLQQAATEADSILYLADNAGEIVFDRLLIELLPHDKLVLVVRGHPVINDATLVDAQVIGLTDLVETIDNGSDAPGVILEDCSPQFCHRFEQADLIISKGQGNYETLSDRSHKDIFFLLQAKCPVIARDLGCQVNTLVMHRTTTTPGCMRVHVPAPDSVRPA